MFKRLTGRNRLAAALAALTRTRDEVIGATAELRAEQDRLTDQLELVSIDAKRGDLVTTNLNFVLGE